MKSELIIAVIMLIMISIGVLVLVGYKNNEKETRGNVVNNKKLYDKKISKALNEFMSYAAFVFPIKDLLVSNSGPNTCNSRNITLRSFGNDEMIICEEEAKFSR